MTDGPSSYLKYLPAVYATQPDPLLGSFLNIFQKLLTGLDDDQLDGRKGIQQLLASQVIGNLFYPRFGFLFPGDDTPIPPISGLEPQQEAAVLDRFNSYIGVPSSAVAGPAGALPLAERAGASPQAPFTAWLDGFLAWLGGWVALVLETDWSIDKKRTMIARILALYRVRGTAQGMGWLVDQWLDLPLTITGVEYQADGGTVPVTGQITVAIANAETPGIVLADRAGGRRSFVLRESSGPDTPLVSGHAPWLFTVRITLPNASRPGFILTKDNAARIQTLEKQLRLLLDRFEPAGTQYRIQMVPGMQLSATGHASRLGTNSFLGSGSKG